VVTSEDPNDPNGMWTTTPIDGNPLTGISCPTDELCVAVDQVGNAFWSTNPAGGAGTWHTVPIDPMTKLFSVSCASVTRCAAVDIGGVVLQTATPTGLATAWSGPKVDNGERVLDRPDHDATGIVDRRALRG
jgi:hypothetical protein